MSLPVMKVLGLGLLALALALPLGACSDDPLTSAEKKAQDAKTALDQEKDKAAAALKQQGEALNKEKQNLEKKIDDTKNEVQGALEKKLAEIGQAKEEALARTAAAKDQLIKEFDSQKSALDARLQGLAGVNAEQKATVEKEIAAGKAALEETFKNKMAVLEADRTALIRKAEQAYEQLKNQGVSLPASVAKD